MRSMRCSSIHWSPCLSQMDGSRSTLNGLTRIRSMTCSRTSCPPETGWCGHWRSRRGNLSRSCDIRGKTTSTKILKWMRSSSSGYLLNANLRDHQLRVGMVPLRRDILEGQPKRLTLAGHERRQVEVDRLVIGAARAQDTDRQLIALSCLSHIILERDLDYRVDYIFIACVGNDSVDIAHRGPDKILCGTRLHIRKFQTCSIGWWWRRLLLFRAKNQSKHANHEADDHNPDKNRTQTGRLLGSRIQIGLKQAIHGGIVLSGAINPG